MICTINFKSPFPFDSKILKIVTFILDNHAHYDTDRYKIYVVLSSRYLHHNVYINYNKWLIIILIKFSQQNNITN